MTLLVKRAFKFLVSGSSTDFDPFDPLIKKQIY